MSEELILSISEASQMLGVSESSLRQWTDEGKIKAFITPGGHRRYSRAELKKFTGSHPRMLGIKDLAAELEDTVRVHREIARISLKKTPWYRELNEESQEKIASQGRRILSLIIKYVTEPSKRVEISRQVQDVGHDIGETLAKSGLPLIDSVEAFILHRDPIINATTHLLKRKEAFTDRVVNAIPLVARIMDEALVALIATHQQYRNGIKDSKTGEEAE